MGEIVLEEGRARELTSDEFVTIRTGKPRYGIEIGGCYIVSNWL